MALIDSLPPPCPEQGPTRQQLAKGLLLEALRAEGPPGVRVRTPEELERSLEETLRQHEPASGLNVFGYGSLMWNPALEVARSHVARVQGWHRRFCLRMVFGRGSVNAPGAMLALDRGGACDGLLFHIEAAKVQSELRTLWQREMLTDSYDVRWIEADVSGLPVRALTFVARRDHLRYIGCRPIEHIAHLIRTGKGVLGTSRAYFECVLRTLDRLNIHDAGIEQLRTAVLRADCKPAASR